MKVSRMKCWEQPYASWHETWGLNQASSQNCVSHLSRIQYKKSKLFYEYLWLSKLGLICLDSQCTIYTSQSVNLFEQVSVQCSFNLWQKVTDYLFSLVWSSVKPPVCSRPYCPDDLYLLRSCISTIQDREDSCPGVDSIGYNSRKCIWRKWG